MLKFYFAIINFNLQPKTAEKEPRCSNCIVLKLVTLGWLYSTALVLLNPLPTTWCHSSMHLYVVKRIKCDFLWVGVCFMNNRWWKI